MPDWYAEGEVEGAGGLFDQILGKSHGFQIAGESIVLRTF